MPTMFNPEQYLSASMETPLERREPLPTTAPESSDGCYFATVKEVKSRVWEGKTEKSAGKSGIAWDISLEIDVPTSLRGTIGMEKLTIRDGLMLDLTDNGLIDSGKGKNGRLRMYREALDLNKPGDSFSALKMVGRPLKVKIEHRPYNDTIQEDVKQVLKAG